MCSRSIILIYIYIMAETILCNDINRSHRLNVEALEAYLSEQSVTDGGKRTGETNGLNNCHTNLFK